MIEDNGKSVARDLLRAIAAEDVAKVTSLLEAAETEIHETGDGRYEAGIVKAALDRVIAARASADLEGGEPCCVILDAVLDHADSHAPDVLTSAPVSSGDRRRLVDVAAENGIFQLVVYLRGRVDFSAKNGHGVPAYAYAIYGDCPLSLQAMEEGLGGFDSPSTLVDRFYKYMSSAETARGRKPVNIIRFLTNRGLLPSDSKLVEYSANGRLDAVRDLLAAFPKTAARVASVQDQGDRVMRAALGSRSQELVKFVLDTYFSTIPADSVADYVAAAAALYQPVIVQTLIERGRDVPVDDLRGVALDAALRAGNEDVALRLLDKRLPVYKPATDGEDELVCLSLQAAFRGQCSKAIDVMLRKSGRVSGGKNFLRATLLGDPEAFAACRDREVFDKVLTLLRETCEEGDAHVVLARLVPFFVAQGNHTFLKSALDHVDLIKVREVTHKPAHLLLMSCLPSTADNRRVVLLLFASQICRGMTDNTALEIATACLAARDSGEAVAFLAHAGFNIMPLLASYSDELYHKDSFVEMLRAVNGTVSDFMRFGLRDLALYYLQKHLACSQRQISLYDVVMGNRRLPVPDPVRRELDEIRRNVEDCRRSLMQMSGLVVFGADRTAPEVAARARTILGDTYVLYLAFQRWQRSGDPVDFPCLLARAKLYGWDALLKELGPGLTQVDDNESGKD